MSTTTKVVPLSKVSKVAKPRQFRALVVEDDVLLARSISREISDWQWHVSTVHTVRDAISTLDDIPDLIVLDVQLADGSGIEVARRVVDLRPFPAIIAISGCASASEAFELGRLGVRGYLNKPIALDEFRATVEWLAHKPTHDIGRAAAARVGTESFLDIQAEVRRAMLVQALALTSGNKTHAARLLDVSRQAVQQMIHDFELE